MQQTTGLSAASREEYNLLDSVEPDPVGFRNQVSVLEQQKPFLALKWIYSIVAVSALDIWYYLWEKIILELSIR